MKSNTLLNHYSSSIYSSFAKDCQADTPTIAGIDLKKSSTFFEEYVLEDAGKGESDYFNQHVAGLSVEDNVTRVWYNLKVKVSFHFYRSHRLYPYGVCLPSL